MYELNERSTAHGNACHVHSPAQATAEQSVDSGHTGSHAALLTLHCTELRSAVRRVDLTRQTGRSQS